MTPEVPGAIVMLADPTNYRQRPEPMQTNGYVRLVSHGTSGREDPRNTATMFQQPNHGASSHFVIGEPSPGQIIIVQCVPLRFAAFHAHEANADSVGIEHCIRAPGTLGSNDPGLAPSTALYQASAQLQAYLLKAAGLEPDRSSTVRGHAEVDTHTTHTVCPVGDGWDWSVFMPMLLDAFAALGAAGAPSTPVA
jgi:N-acetyl-anhydromuramyl-L-alanine amidase AmpD